MFKKLIQNYRNNAEAGQAYAYGGGIGLILVVVLLIVLLRGI